MCKKDFRKWINHEQLGRESCNVLGAWYTTYVLLLWRVWRDDCSGHLRGNRQQWRFFKNTNFDYFIQSYKNLYIEWSKTDQFRDDLTPFAALKCRETMQFFYVLLISTTFGKFSLADISEGQQMLLCFFLIHRPHILLLSKSLCQMGSKSASEIAKLC